MTLYEIDYQLAVLLQQVSDAIDPETGEVPEDAWEGLNALQLQREDLIEQMGLDVKNRRAEAAACKKEADALRERAKRLEAGADIVEGRVAAALNGEKFSTPRVAMTWRKSTSTRISDEAAFMEWAMDGGDRERDFVNTKITRAPIKDAIKKAIDRGEDVPGCEVITNYNMSIK